MASNYFTFSPTTGTSGSRTVTVKPASANGNYSTTDKRTLMTVTNGAATGYVSVTQYGIPSITRQGGSGNVPATGQRLTYGISTHYPFVFRSVPDWVTITDSIGRTYQEYDGTSSTIYPVSYASADIYVNVAANTSAETRTCNMNMGHILRGSLAQTTAGMYFQQSGTPAPVAYINISGNLLFEYNDSHSQKSITVSASGPWDYNVDDPSGKFTYGVDGNTLRVITQAANTTTEDWTDYIFFFLESNPYINTGGYAIQKFQPRFDIPHPSVGYNVDAINGNKPVSIQSSYNWWLTYPSYVTFKDLSGNTITNNASNPIIGDGVSQTYYLYWDDNTTSSDRVSPVCFNYKNVNGSTIGSAITRTFTQAHSAPLVLTDSNSHYDGNGGYEIGMASTTLTPTLTAAYSWTAAFNTQYNNSHLRILNGSGNAGSSTFNIGVSPYTGTGAPRWGGIIITDSQGNTLNITIKQWPQTITVSPSTIHFAATNPTTAGVSVTGSTANNWTLSENSGGWIVKVSGWGGGSGPGSFYVSALNNEERERNATITVDDGLNTVTISVSQDGQN